MRFFPIEKHAALSDPHMLFQGRIQAQAYDVSAYKLVADQLLESAKVRLLFHALAVGFRDGHLLVETKSGRRAVRGEIFIDCSGDGRSRRLGRSALRSRRRQGHMLYPSTMYRIGGVDPQKAGNAWERIAELMEAAERKGRRFPRKKPIVRPQTQPGRVAREPDADPQRGRQRGERHRCRAARLGRGRRAPPGLGHLPVHPRVDARFERAYIAEIAPQIGIRETRRVRGEYQLSEDDVLDCADFPDAIGVNGWPVEEHVAGNVEFRFQRTTKGYNQLPYRMLLPRGAENLLVAGRCASMTHGGQSAARVSGPCFVMGQAAGSAAHLCLNWGSDPCRWTRRSCRTFANHRSMARMKVERIAGALGAEITGIDLRRLGEAELAEIRRTWLEHLVVFFRDQGLSAEEFMAFARRIGRPIEYPFVRGIAGFPEVIEVKKLEHEKINFGGIWHSDTAYLEEPPMASMLLAREVPPRGGDTLFANMLHGLRIALPTPSAAISVLTPVFVRSASHVGLRRGVHRNERPITAASCHR